MSTEGHWLQVNRPLCNLLGYDEAELLEKTFQQVTYPDDLATDLGHVTQMLAGEIDTYQIEKRYIHKEGHVVWGVLDSIATSCGRWCAGAFHLSDSRYHWP